MRRALPLATTTLVLLLAAGCASEGETTVEVVGTNDACTADTASAPAGSITFAFTNEASDVNELYVLNPDGSVASELENVTTGVTRDLTVGLRAGTYTLNCKPGMTGDGFSSTIEVTGEGGGSAAPAADREVVVVATEFSFAPQAPLAVTAGETLKIELRNEGAEEHELEVFSPDGTALGEVPPTEPGAEGAVTVTFDEPGTYRFVCGIEGHEANGMALDVPVATS